MCRQLTRLMVPVHQNAAYDKGTAVGRMMHMQIVGISKRAQQFVDSDTVDFNWHLPKCPHLHRGCEVQHVWLLLESRLPTDGIPLAR